MEQITLAAVSASGKIAGIAADTIRTAVNAKSKIRKNNQGEQIRKNG